MSTSSQYALNIHSSAYPAPPYWKRFPKTRYQGSKRKLLPFLYRACSQLPFQSVLDLYSGTGIVSILFRSMHRTVFANDYLYFNTQAAAMFLSVQNQDFAATTKSLLDALLYTDAPGDSVQQQYKGLYFTDEENRQIDNFVQNVQSLPAQQRRIYTYAVGQALLKKRPYNLFHRANLNMRFRDVQRSFGNATTWSKSISEHAYSEIEHLASFPFDELPPHGNAFNYNTCDLSSIKIQCATPDLLYLDPPYLNRKGKSVDYSEFYHFLEGLWDYSLFANPNITYPHRPLVRLDSRWKTPEGGLSELEDVAQTWPSSILVLSYRNDGLPSQSDTVDALSIGGRKAHVYHAEEYKYALSKDAATCENIILSMP